MRFILLTFSLSSLWSAEYLHCGKLLDVGSGQLQNDAAILIQTGKITRVEAASAFPAPPGATTVDLPKATCLSGLIDVHVHITGDPKDSGYAHLGVSVPRATVTGVKNARAT